MTRLSSGEIRGGEPEPNLLWLRFAMSSVNDGGSDLWSGVAGWSLIARSVVPCIRGSIAGCPVSSSVARVLLGLATVIGVLPSGGPANHPRLPCELGL
jgi:hypothetical protein